MIHVAVCFDMQMADPGKANGNSQNRANFSASNSKLPNLISVYIIQQPLRNMKLKLSNWL